MCKAQVNMRLVFVTNNSAKIRVFRNGTLQVDIKKNRLLNLDNIKVRNLVLLVVSLLW